MFGQNLLNALRKKNISQKQIADSLKLSPACINGYIKNTREPDFATLVKIAQYLDCSIDQLITANINDAIDPDYAKLISLWNKMNSLQKATALGYLERITEEFVLEPKNEITSPAVNKVLDSENS